MGYFTIDRWVISQLMEVAIVLPMTPTGQSLAVKDQRLTWGFWPQNMVFLLIKNWWGKLYSFTNKIMNLPIYFSLFFTFGLLCKSALGIFANEETGPMLTSVQRRHESQAEPGFDHELTIYIYIYIYGPVLRLSTPPSSPPNGLGPQVAAPNSLLFASYWQHVWGPASYLLGLCSISDY